MYHNFKYRQHAINCTALIGTCADRLDIYKLCGWGSKGCRIYFSKWGEHEPLGIQAIVIYIYTLTSSDGSWITYFR